MFSNLGFGEILMMALVGLVIFGPERLPKAASDAARVIRQLRSMADTAVTDFKAELPPDLAELDLRSMNPRSLLTDAIFDPRRDGSTVPGHDGADGEEPELDEDFVLIDGDVPEGQEVLFEDDFRQAVDPGPARASS